jgi:hypothetical protein
MEAAVAAGIPLRPVAGVEMLLRLAAVAIVVAVEAAVAIVVAVEAAVAIAVAAVATAVAAGGKGSRQVSVVRNQESGDRCRFFPSVPLCRSQPLLSVSPLRRVTSLSALPPFSSPPNT